MSTPHPTRKQQREEARAAREASQAAQAAREQRTRRMQQFGGVLLAAIVVIVIAVVATGGGDSKKATKKAGEVVAGQTEVREMLAGIPQDGDTLGDPAAKVTMLEFADLQCPVCRDYSLQVLPQVVQDYVRTGKVKIKFRPFTVIDEDSNVGWTYAAGAGEQGKLWNFVDLTYFNQGQERSGWVTPAKLKEIGAGVAGLDWAKVTAYSRTPAARAALAKANTLAGLYGVKGTPTVVVGPSGGAMKTVDGIGYDAIAKALDAALGT